MNKFIFINHELFLNICNAIQWTANGLAKPCTDGCSTVVLKMGSYGSGRGIEKSYTCMFLRHSKSRSNMFPFCPLYLAKSVTGGRLQFFAIHLQPKGKVFCFVKEASSLAKYPQMAGAGWALAPPWMIAAMETSKQKVLPGGGSIQKGRHHYVQVNV